MTTADRATHLIARVGSLRVMVWLVVALLLLVLSLIVNANQWLNHREYVRNEADRLKLAASLATTKAVARIASERQADNKKLLADLEEIAERGRTTRTVYAKAAKARPLPAQCAPGKARIAAVNAGADK